MKVLVLGVTGMLGNTVFRYCYNETEINAYGTLRNPSSLRHFPEKMHDRLISCVDVLDHDSLVSVIATVKPDIIINCVGLIKQLSHANDPLNALPINSLLPHQLANLCSLANVRLIHISTDCVFSGEVGLCKENDKIEPPDLYGMSKYIGEISNLNHVITLRTSIIGHELSSAYALIEWFLSQTGQVKGYSNAIFSGFPTIELAKIIFKYIIPNADLHGLYHVSSEPIDKYSLLKLVAKIYGKEIDIIDDTEFKIDRSLDSSCFRKKVGYKPPTWTELIKSMYEFH